MILQCPFVHVSATVAGLSATTSLLCLITPLLNSSVVDLSSVSGISGFLLVFVRVYILQFSPWFSIFGGVALYSLCNEKGDLSELDFCAWSCLVCGGGG